MGQLPEGGAPLAGDLLVPVEGALGLRRGQSVPALAGQRRRVAHDPGFSGNHRARRGRVARDRRRLGLLQTDDLRQRQNPIRERRPLCRIDDDLGKRAVEIAAAERRAPLGQRLQDPRRAARADRPAQFVLSRPPLALGCEIDDLGRHRRPLARDPFALGIARLGGPITVAEVGPLAAPLHARSDRARMHGRLAVDPPVGIAAAVDALLDTGLLQRPIADSFPLLPDRFDLARSGPETVQLARLGAKPVGADLPRRHQHMRVVIPLVAVPVGRVDRKIDRHPITLDQTRGKFLHGGDLLRVAELVRQRHDDVSPRRRILPARRAILGAFGRIPQLAAVPDPFWSIGGRRRSRCAGRRICA